MVVVVVVLVVVCMVLCVQCWMLEVLVGGAWLVVRVEGWKVPSPKFFPLKAF
mgnify:CR=1 FL=1